MKVKFQNSEKNRKLLTEAGYTIYDPAATFVCKPWIIIGDDGKLYGVQHRSFPIVLVEEFLENENEL